LPLKKNCGKLTLALSGKGNATINLTCLSFALALNLRSVVMFPSLAKANKGHVWMAMLISDWVWLIASAWTYVPLHDHSLLALGAIAILSYWLGYLCSQMQFPGRLKAGRKPPPKQTPEDLS
jgi:hypothetical protein